MLASQRREDLVWVHNTLGIHRLLDSPHQTDAGCTTLLLEELHLAQANAVLTADLQGKRYQQATMRDKQKCS